MTAAETGSATAQDRSGLGAVARGSVLNLFAAGVAAIVNFGLALVVTRGVSPTTAGVYFSSTSLFLLGTTLGQLGSSTGLIYFISRARAQGRTELIPTYMRTAGVPVLVTATAVMALTLVFGQPIAEALGQGERVGDLQYFVSVLAIFVPVAGLLNLAMAGTRGLGTMRPTALIGQIIRPTLQLVGVCLVVLLAHDRWISWAWGLAFVPACALAWAAWRRRSIQVVGAREASSEKVGRPFWAFTGPRALASVTQLAMQRLDIILVGALSGLKDAAVYAAVTRFLVLGGMVSGAVSTAVQPRLGEALGRSDHESARDLYATSTAWLLMLSWPIYLMLILFAPVVVRVFGEAYATGADALVIICVSMLVATGCGTVDMVLNMAGKTTWNLYNVILAFAVNLSLDILLIPHLGLVGAAIGWAAAIVTANLVPLSQIHFVLHLHPFGSATRTAMAISLASFAVVPAAVRLVIPSGFVALVIAGLVGSCIYVVLLVVSRQRLRLTELVRARDNQGELSP